MKDRMIRSTKIIWFTGWFFILFARRIHAYIDPSVTTYAIQAAAGIVIGLSAFFNIYWRRIARRFHLDDTYTERETDALYFDDPATGKRTVFAEELAEVKGNAPRRISDILYALFTVFFFVYLIFVYAPIEIYVHNIHEFWFDIYIMIRSIVPVFFVIMAVLMVIAYLLHRYSRRAFLAFGAVFFALAVIHWIQGGMLVYHMPPMDGTTPVWSEYIGDMIISGLLIIAVVSAVILGFRFMQERMKYLMILISAVVSAVLVFSTASLPFTTNVLDRKLHYIVSDNRNMELGKKNFVIFLLDAVDSRIVQKQLAEDPEYYAENFKDFMYYPDTAGTYAFTQEAVPFIINGKWFENQEDFHDFQTTAMRESPLLSGMEKDHWQIDYYDHDLMYITLEEDMGRYRNVYHYDAEFKSSLGYTLTQLKLTMFKYGPFFIKPLTGFTPDDFLAERNIPEGMIPNNFNFSDIRLYEQLKNEGFRVDPSVENNFKFYHLDGAHVPFEYDEDLNIIPTGTGTYDVDVKVSMKVAAEFVKQLRETDVYDDTVVIILADHGYNYADEGYPGRGNPLLMVKGFNEHHDFKVSKAPISFADLQDTYARLLEGKTGDEQFAWKEGDERIRRYMGYMFTHEDDLTEYTVEGNASDVKSFIPTGKHFYRE